MSRLAGVLLLLVASCSFDPTGFANNAPRADAAPGAADAAPGTADAAAIDGGASADAAAGDANEVPDAAAADARSCADCDDGVSCTEDLCDPSTGDCQHVDACAAGQVCDLVEDRCEGTVSFREGVAGYAGTQDTQLMEVRPTDTSSSQTFGWDAAEPNGSDNRYVGLLRFDDIIGSGPGRVPPGALILSATIDLTVQNPNPSTVGGEDTTVTEVAVSWDQDTATWNNFGGSAGVQPAELAALVADFAAVSCMPPCPLAIDVRESLERWVAVPGDNLGWAFETTGNNGLYVYSSERVTVADRPRLTVEFAVP